MKETNASFPGSDLYTHFYRQWKPFVTARAKLLCGCEQSAEDLMQEVFIRCWLKFTQFEEVKDMQSYLFILTRNLFLNNRQRRKREQIGLAALTAHFRQYWPPTEDPVLEKEYRLLLQEAVRSLPRRQQQVFILSKELRLSRKEIARQLGMSEFTVKEHTARAMKALRKSLRKD